MSSAPPPRTKIPTLSELDTVIITGRLRLRPLAEGDVDDMWPVVSDPEFPRMMTWAAHTDKQQTLDYVRYMQAAFAAGTAIAWAIEYQGKVVGNIGLDDIAFQRRASRVDRAELGYWLAPKLWNNGLMTEAATAAVRWGFDVLGLHKITVGCLVENLASKKVIEKLGFKYVGRLEDDLWRDDRWWSHLRYELTANEWVDVSTTLRVNRPHRT